MSGQLDYYNRFAEFHKSEILKCPEPEFWTTDYSMKGRIYREISERLSEQQEFIEKHFSLLYPVLDIGCGFGRQSLILAKKGYSVTGIDTSEVFIEICVELFQKNNLKGKFITGELKDLQPVSFSQAILFDVIEHIPAPERKKFIKEISTIISPGSVLLISLPHLKKRLRSILNNSVRKRITQYFPVFLSREEHPYPIPGKKEVLRLIDPYFTLLEFKETSLTDYYALRK